jgi:uncharacterized protein (DUF1778 family)
MGFHLSEFVFDEAGRNCHTMCVQSRKETLMPVNASKPGKDRRINLRATSVQESLIRAAADKRGISMTDFVLESACTRAEETIADQVHFVLSPKQWKAFTDALERPARVKPRLRKLLTEPSVLERR